MLIRVETAPINPSDKMHLKGSYGDRSRIKEGPIGTGFEGSGQVSKLGEGVDAKFENAKVGFFDEVHSPTFTGSFAQYIVRNAADVIAFPESVEYNDIGSVFVNPLTVTGFIDVA